MLPRVGTIALTTVLSLWSLPGRGAAPPWTAEDIVLAERVDAMEVSADGALALWQQSAMDDAEGKRVSNLFLARLDGGAPQQLTRGKGRNGAPRFSPDGAWVSFLSDRPLPKDGAGEKDPHAASVQLWLLPLAGGEPHPVTHLSREIVAYRWLDRTSIVFAAPEAMSERERRLDESKDTSLVVEDAAHTPPVRLFRLDVNGGEVRRLTNNRDWIDLLELSPDGHFAVARAAQSLSYQYDQKTPPATYLVDLASGRMERILAGRRVPQTVTWMPDGTGFYFTADVSTHPVYTTASVTKLFAFDLATRASSEIPLGWERGLDPGQNVIALADGFLARLADGAWSHPARYTRSGAGFSRQDLSGEHARQLWDWASSKDGRVVVYEHSTPHHPTAWLAAELEGAELARPRQVTRLNPGFEGKPRARWEVLRYAGARGEEVEAILRYPLDYREGERHPLILATHGGPLAADFASWQESVSRPMLLFQQRGAFVLEVNYHGSSHYGLAFAESIAGGHYYELEIPDLLAGVELLAAKGLIDLERLGAIGWSNGGILTAELLTRDPRFKAASIGAADVEWISDWGNVDFGASFDNYYFGASPLEKPAFYVEKSPFFRLGNAATPTLLFSGTEDRNVPPSQSWSHFRALQQLGKVPVKLVLFPGEPHGLQRLAHQRRKIAEDLAWFDRYLFGTSTPELEALREGSPLERALAVAKVARVGAAYGTRAAGTLIPELVERGALRIGRFEVTRAQFRAFEPTFPVPPGAENLPATGLSFEEATRYVRWLAEKLKLRVRLPTEAEANALCAEAKRVGEANTLDRWAGYAPTPEEAEELRILARDLPTPGALLVEVGRSDATDDHFEPLFDLGGNAAEWAVTAAGEGKAACGSADQPADPLNALTPGPAYQGLRVVADP